MSELIDNAKEVSLSLIEYSRIDPLQSIMILDWWLSPEIQVSSEDLDPLRAHDAQLRRPAALFPEWRLDRLLQKKAEQGVRIYVMVYKEVSLCGSIRRAYPPR